jgi:hypothetical protein
LPPADSPAELTAIPAAGALRDTYAAELAQVAKNEHDAASTDALLVLASGLALLAVLVGFQFTLKRRFGRTLNSFLALGTVATAVLLIAGLAMNSEQSQRLQDAVGQRMAPYLDIQHARAIAYDATGDAIRYAVAPKFGYDRGYSADAHALKAPDGSGLLHTGLRRTDAALVQSVDGDWTTVSADAGKIMHAVDQGDTQTALASATASRAARRGWTSTRSTRISAGPPRPSAPGSRPGWPTPDRAPPGGPGSRPSCSAWSWC